MEEEMEVKKWNKLTDKEKIERLRKLTQMSLFLIFALALSLIVLLTWKKII